MILGKSVLWLSALLFSGYGLTSLFSPEIPAGFAGLAMTNGDAFAEIGAMYGGLQLGLGLLCLLAALKPNHYQAGLLLLVVGVGILALARLYSALIAPAPVGAYTIGAICYELSTATLAGIAIIRFNSNKKIKLDH